MPNGTYGGVRGKKTKVGQKTFVSRPTRFVSGESSEARAIEDVGGGRSYPNGSE